MSPRSRFVSAATLSATVASLIHPLAQAQLSTCEGTAGVDCPTSVPMRVQRFGLVSVASGQVLQLHVAAVDPPNTVNPPDTTPACKVQIKLLSASGAVVRSSSTALAPGQSTQLSVNGPRQLGARQALRAEVLMADTADGATSGGSCAMSTMEIYDPVTGRTSVLTGPGMDAVVNPPDT